MFSIILTPVYNHNTYSGKRLWPPVYPSYEYQYTLKEWCKENVGPNNWNYYGEYKKVPYEFRFKESADLLAFKLKFGL